MLLPRLHVFRLEQNIDLFGRLWTLKFLAVQHLFFQLVNGFACSSKSLGNLAITTTIACCHQISNATALEECALIVGWIEDLAELDHLH